jgi:radical SAM superfamily enzyme YgiQ (UPF0313 family)
MPRVLLVNPSLFTVGYSFFTPRWLFVLAQATPIEIGGDPILIDESLESFRPELVQPGDFVGIGMSTGNCKAAYRVLKLAKSRGATVIMGGVHASIFPDEALRMGADSVVTGNGDLVWSKALYDAVEGRLAKRYDGGRVSGDALAKARWDLLDPSKYLFPTVQTLAGCPENCSFCSVWVTDGRQPRMRLADKVIDEVNELYALGFRHVAFADDNFNPGTLGRIRREPGAGIRKQLERIREERLRFFKEYGARVPANVFSLTQMTWEVLTDEEYFAALYNKIRLRAALIGVESFSEDGLITVNKSWNPLGRQMMDAIQAIQDRGILVLSSVICGLESDTVDSIRTMRRFVQDSGTLLAQFTNYNPFPGAKDYYELVTDRKRFREPGYAPKHKIRLAHDEFWLKPLSQVEIVEHPAMTAEEWARENRACWNSYYSLRESIRRVQRGWAGTWSLAGKITYVFACRVFRRVYAGNGLTADGVNQTRLSFVTRILIKVGVAIHDRYFRHTRVPLRLTAVAIASGQNR